MIELITAIAILAILLTMVIATLNPLVQRSKAQDAQREHDLEQVQQALDTYYNDTGCYPQTLVFGIPWQVGSTVYMSKVPIDPLCKSDPNHCYLYQTDTTSSCPQWNVLYSALQARSTTDTKVYCPLEAMNNCIPSDYSGGSYNFCLVSGSIDCNYLAQNPLPTPPILFPTQGPTSPPIIFPTATPLPPTSTPTPTVFSCPPGENGYACTGQTQQNPQGTCNLESDPHLIQYCNFSGCNAGACCNNNCN